MGNLSYTTQEIDNKLTPAYGGIHTHDNAVAQSIANGTTYVKVINFMDNEVTKNVTSDALNNKIVFTKSGVYRIEGSVSFAAGTGNINVFCSIFLNGNESDNIHFTRKIGTAGDVGTAAISGLLQIDVNDEIDLRVRHSSGAPVNFTFSYININVSRIDI